MPTAATAIDEIVVLSDRTFSEIQPTDSRLDDTAVKEQLDEMNIAADFYNALDEDVAKLIEDAARRAEANDRKTVQPRDL